MKINKQKNPKGNLKTLKNWHIEHFPSLVGESTSVLVLTPEHRKWFFKVTNFTRPLIMRSPTSKHIVLSCCWDGKVGVNQWRYLQMVWFKWSWSILRNANNHERQLSIGWGIIFLVFWETTWTVILQPTFWWWCTDKSPHPLHLMVSCVTSFFSECLSPDIYSSFINITFTVEWNFELAIWKCVFPTTNILLEKCILKIIKYLLPLASLLCILISGTQKWKWILGHSHRYCQRKKEMKSLSIFKSF